MSEYGSSPYTTILGNQLAIYHRLLKKHLDSLFKISGKVQSYLIDIQIFIKGEFYFLDSDSFHPYKFSLDYFQL